MSEPFKGLKIVDILGVFYREDGCLMAADEFEGARDVDAVLREFDGIHVRVLAHHRPHEPHDKARWGGGCCVLENSGSCHFGHHERPDAIYTFNGVGRLRSDGERWVLDPLDEGDVQDCRVGLLVGHRSQIVVTSIPDFDQIDEKVKSFDPSDLEDATLEDLTDRLGEMRDYLAELNRLKNDVNG
jgi:hypothetical protein